MRILTSSILWGLLSSCAPLFANPLKPLVVESITNAICTHFNGVELEVKLITKKKKGIRASIFSEDGVANSVLIFDQHKLYLLTKDGYKKLRSKEIFDREAAENLFQMLALNPWLHFPDGTLALRSPILDHFHIIYDCDRDYEYPKPRQMQLYATGANESTLLSTIEFINFFDENTPYLQPKTLRVTDHTTETIGTVEVENFSYNEGLADYLFQSPEETPNTQYPL